MARSTHVNRIATSRPPGGFFDATCCYPNCEAASSALVEEPICDTHITRVHRAVSLLLKEFKPPEVGRPAVKHEPKHAGLVYFIKFGNRIKIGFTTNLAQRLTQLPHDEVLVTVAGSFSTEKRLHNKFKHLRVVGEWFEAAPELLEYTANLRAGGGRP